MVEYCIEPGCFSSALPIEFRSLIYLFVACGFGMGLLIPFLLRRVGSFGIFTLVAFVVSLLSCFAMEYFLIHPLGMTLVSIYRPDLLAVAPAEYYGYIASGMTVNTVVTIAMIAFEKDRRRELRWRRKLCLLATKTPA